MKKTFTLSLSHFHLKLLSWLHHIWLLRNDIQFDKVNKEERNFTMQDHKSKKVIKHTLEHPFKINNIGRMIQGIDKQWWYIQRRKIKNFKSKHRIINQDSSNKKFLWDKIPLYNIKESKVTSIKTQDTILPNGKTISLKTLHTKIK